MATALLRNQTAAIEHFINDKQNGAAWKRVLLEAPAFAMERIAISMYASVYRKQMTPEEKEAYRTLRESIDSSLRKEDLDYLIKVMPASKKPYYQSLLNLLPQREEAKNSNQAVQQIKSPTQTGTSTQAPKRRRIISIQ